MNGALSRRAALLLPLAAALPGRARAQQGPIVDALGRSVVLRKPAERIVLTFNFEEYTAVAGAAGWPRVVGFDRNQWAVNRPNTWARYKAALPGLEAIADVGGTESGTFSTERVLALRPDLVITIAAGYALRAAQMAQIEAAGVPVLVLDYNAQTVEKHVASTLALGAATGQSERAAELASLYRRETEAIMQRAAGLARPRAYVENGAGGPGKVGNSYNHAMWGRLLDMAGAANIANDRIPAGWSPLQPEYVLAAAPEHVFILGASWSGSSEAARAGFGVTQAEAQARLEGYAARPGWAELPALRQRSLHVIETSLARSLWDWTALQYMAKAIHPAHFADLDPVASLRRYHEAYLPVAFEGCWMACAA